MRKRESSMAGLFMLAVLLVYLIITAISNVGLKWLETRYSRGFERSTS